MIAFPNVHLSEYDLFRQKLKVVHAGVTIGELKGKDVIPDHSLAMSTLLNHDGFSRFELTYEQAIAYLRKEAIALDASVPRGYILLTYKNIPLGFAKNIGNRRTFFCMLKGAIDLFGKIVHIVFHRLAQCFSGYRLVCIL